MLKWCSLVLLHWHTAPHCHVSHVIFQYLCGVRSYDKAAKPWWRSNVLAVGDPPTRRTEPARRSLSALQIKLKWKSVKKSDVKIFHQRKLIPEWLPRDHVNPFRNIQESDKYMKVYEMAHDPWSSVCRSSKAHSHWCLHGQMQMQGAPVHQCKTWHKETSSTHHFFVHVCVYVICILQALTSCASIRSDKRYLRLWVDWSTHRISCCLRVSHVSLRNKAKASMNFIGFHFSALTSQWSLGALPQGWPQPKHSMRRSVARVSCKAYQEYTKSTND